MAGGFDRKFEVWTFTDDAFPKAVELEVRYKGPDNKASGPIVYYIKSDVPRVNVEATTFDGLRQKALAALRDWFVIRWEKRVCLSVSLLQDEGYGDKITQVYKPMFEVEEVEQGLGADGRSTYHRKPGAKSVYEGPYSPGAFRRSDIRFVLLLDTPEVRAQIETLRGQFDAAVKALFESVFALGDALVRDYNLPAWQIVAPKEERRHA